MQVQPDTSLDWLLLPPKQHGAQKKVRWLGCEWSCLPSWSMAGQGNACQAVGWETLGQWVRKWNGILRVLLSAAAKQWVPFHRSGRSPSAYTLVNLKAMARGWLHLAGCGLRYPPGPMIWMKTTALPLHCKGCKSRLRGQSAGLSPLLLLQHAHVLVHRADITRSVLTRGGATRPNSSAL